ncbi:MAG: sigma-70 family RNA polymerase sigma factor [Clostridia bacterium]|nr:sigma-70 family RNA polymerase sigma factor [Clostridia bacterium]
MTDQQYYECYSKLVERLAATHELDRYLFCSIFEGKIKPIIRNIFSGYSEHFSAIDIEDVYQDIFVKLWTNSVSAYFMNEKYESDASWFLGWCKIVAKNHVTSLLRRRSLKASETIDDPERPVVAVDPDAAADEVSNREAVASVLRSVASLPSKIEMKLVWYGIYLLVYRGEAEDRIEANRVFVERFSGVSWRELSERAVLWLCETEETLGEDCGAAALERASSDGASEDVIGDMLGDDPIGKISDWIYKINKRLKDSLPSEVM